MNVDDFCLRLSKDCGVEPGAHVLAAVSGGADSTALLCFLCEAAPRMGLKVSCAHVEHGIRGAQSLADMAFVQALCESKGVAFYALRADAPALAAQSGCGLEDAARRIRRAFLQKTAQNVGADAIALAHHRGDQAETVLLHAARGSDLRGLGAMRARRGMYIRPLLNTESGELRDYLERIGQPWREDATNADERFARNRIRRQVLPQLEAAYPGAEAALCRLSYAAQRDEDYFAHALDALRIPVIALSDGVALEAGSLQGLHPALLSRMLVRALESAGIAASGTFVETLMNALARGEAFAASAQGVQARLGETYLCLTRPDAQIADTQLCMDGVTHTPFGAFTVRRARSGETGDGLKSQVIPLCALQGACVTMRREGDAIIPFGRKTSAKLKKLMIDAGIERAMRNSVPVLRADCGVLWAVGLRPSQYCAAQDGQETAYVAYEGDAPWINKRYESKQEESDHERKQSALR